MKQSKQNCLVFKIVVGEESLSAHIKGQMPLSKMFSGL